MAYDSRAIAKLLQDEKHKEYFPVDYPLFYMTRQVSNSDSIDGTDNESKEEGGINVLNKTSGTHNIDEKVDESAKPGVI